MPLHSTAPRNAAATTAAAIITAQTEKQAGYKKRKDVKGTVYLLHFSQKYHHAGHYLGFAETLENRLEQHRKGQGARLTQVIKDADIEFECVRTWEGTRDFERQLKNRHDARSLCPNCRQERSEEKKTWRANRKTQGEN
jgi:predicted GIY-YIG superfamily endonuclease